MEDPREKSYNDRQRLLPDDPSREALRDGNAAVVAGRTKTVRSLLERTFPEAGPAGMHQGAGSQSDPVLPGHTAQEGRGPGLPVAGDLAGG